MARNGKGLFLLGVLGVVGLLGFGVSEGHAAFTVKLDSITPLSPNDFQFNYSAAITATDKIVTNDFFRIYDFGNYIPGTVKAPAGWSVASNLTDPLPPPNVILTHGDDPALTNFTFTYTAAPAITGPTNITGFSAESTITTTVLKDFVGRLTQATGALTGQKIDSVGPNLVVPGAVPEPASMITCGLGVLFLGIGYARHHRKNVIA